MDWPHVYRREDGRWNVDTGLRIKPRRRQICETLADVERVKADWRDEYHRGGTEHTLSTDQRYDAFQALALLKKTNAKESLYEAVRWFCRHRYPTGGDPTMQDLAKDFVVFKRQATTAEKGTFERLPRYSKPYLSSLTKILKFGEKFGGKRASDITAEEISGYLDSLPLGETARWHYFHYFKMVFNHAVKHGRLEKNPMAIMQAPRLRPPEPTVLTCEEVGALLHHAWLDHDGVVVPYLTLGLFCGVRPHELLKLKWGDFRENGRKLRIPQDVAKTRDVRVVSVPTCADGILEEFRQRIGEPKPGDMLVPLTHNLLRKRFRQVFRKAGIKEWPHDACRHTFASFYLKATGSMPRLMEQLGHAHPAMTLKHYVNLTDEPWEHYFTMGCTEDQMNNQTMFIVNLADPDEDNYLHVKQPELARCLLDHDYSVLPLEQRPNYRPPKPLEPGDLPFGDYFPPSGEQALNEETPSSDSPPIGNNPSEP